MPFSLLSYVCKASVGHFIIGLFNLMYLHFSLFFNQLFDQHLSLFMSENKLNHVFTRGWILILIGEKYTCV